MENNDFYKDILNKIEPPSFKEEYWAEIDEKLNNRKKNRRIIWWPLFFVISFGCAIAIYCFNNYCWGDKTIKSNEYAINESIISSSSNLNEKLIDTSTRDNTEKNKTILVNKTKKSGSFNQRNNFNTFKYNGNEFNKIDIIVKMNKEKAPVFSKNVIMGSENSSLSIKNVSSAKHIMSIANTLESPIEKFNINSLLYRKLLVKKLETPKLETMLIYPIKSFIKRPSKKRFYLDISLGLNQINKKLLMLNDLYGDYYNKRNNEENKNFVITPKLQLGYITKKGLKTAIGLEYFKYGENINYSPYYFQKDYINNTFYHYDSTKSYNFITRSIKWKYDTTKQVFLDSIYSKKRNDDLAIQNNTTQISYFEIPVCFGYQKTVKKFSFSFMSGISFGIINYRQLKGSYININTKELNSLKSESYNFNNFNISYSIQFRMSKNIFKNCNIYLEPTYKSNLTPIFNNQIIKQKYSTAGAYIGFSYFLR